MNKKLSTFRMTTVAVVCVMTVALGLPATAVTMSDLMKYLPQDAQIAVGLPDIEAVETAGAPLMEIGPASLKTVTGASFARPVPFPKR